MRKFLLNFLFIIIAVCLNCLLTSCVNKNKTITINTLLNEMIDRNAIARFPEPTYKLKQVSSYNRASISPKDSIDWFKNKDYNSNKKDSNFVRIEENNGQKEWVLMDEKGPGTIVRFWMPFNYAKANKPNYIIKFYLDGSDKPALEGNLPNLLNGTGQIPFPLAHKSLLSAVSFFPIPYAKSCKVTVTKQPYFYQLTYRKYIDGTKVKTLTMKDFNKEKSLITKVCNTLLSPESNTLDKTIEQKQTITAGKEESVNLPDRTSAIKALSIKLDNYTDSTITQSVILKIEFDGKKTVWCPIGDFFGTGIGLHPFKGWYRTVAEDGTLYSRWIMPYQHKAKITLVNLSKHSIDYEMKVTVEDWNWDDRSMYFYAGFRQQYPVPTRPFSDWNYITLKGRGVYVGDALTIMNPVKKWWGEGDEKIWVDGENFPSLFGTGTEDYYGYSWGGKSTDFYEHPFHAQPRSNKYDKLHRKNTNERNSQGLSTETRTRSLDGIPFNNSLKLDMEVWSWTDCNMYYSVGVYWYGNAEIQFNCKHTYEKSLINTSQLKH